MRPLILISRCAIDRKLLAGSPPSANFAKETAGRVAGPPIELHQLTARTQSCG